MRSPVEQEIRDLIGRRGRITFARFMQTCLYSPNGGFYSARAGGINAHFGTSSTSHPAFGVLIARQLEQMWDLLGRPPVFHLVEVGSGDGSLARAIVDACQRSHPQFAGALRYVAADYRPHLAPTPNRAAASVPDAPPSVQPVMSDGLRAFRNITGCILSNELIDNFPVHRFEVRDGRVREVYVAASNGSLVETLGDPSTPRIVERLNALGMSLPEGCRGEVNLAIDGWAGQIADALDRGFVLTIDYGGLAHDLYSPDNAGGTLVCYHRHVAGNDPYLHVGEQDITCLVDFTSLMQSGERRGLATVGYTSQREFLANLGFDSIVDAIETTGMSAARAELSRIAMMTLVDPDEYGDFKVLAQAKGIEPDVHLLGFVEQPE